jgi:hypothetical protein
MYGEDGSSGSCDQANKHLVNTKRARMLLIFSRGLLLPEGLLLLPPWFISFENDTTKNNKILVRHNGQGKGSSRFNSDQSFHQAVINPASSYADP